MQKISGRRALLGGVAILGLAAAIVVSTSTGASAKQPLARAALRNASGASIGEVVFKGEGHYADRVEVELALPAGAPGLGSYHGFHIHTVGSCGGATYGTDAGGHWNPDGVGHGQHKGDLPSVLIGPDGKAYAEFETHRFDVTELFDANGSAVILHAGVDNFGNVPIASDRYQDPNNWYNAPTGTRNTGDAGARYGCGVVQPA